MKVPVLILINKIDLSNQKELETLVAQWHEALPEAEIYPISAQAKFNVDRVLARIRELLPDSPPYFDKDQWTDKPARFFVTEILREKILLYYDKEIPYAVEVVVEEFKEEEKRIHIRAVIYVERDSQRVLSLVIAVWHSRRCQPKRERPWRNSSVNPSSWKSLSR